ncbi:S-layer homology domain-containing protein [Bacillus solimangrovi]|uniref:SLH domain-containing protein n=1 Tax=Bacillus solimangrovi TaxID=1305675 RepID=A0A1E5LJ44_9BACI|nr:S-layer homology domain-containing protein [Bacillus solimangrovi]OEH94107.1 hypothetical protein BFG57_09680 [Bacillus solimangrovi]
MRELPLGKKHHGGQFYEKSLIIGATLLTLSLGQTVQAADISESTPLVAAATKKANIQLSDSNGHWAQSDIEFMVEQGVIGGFPDGTFRPNDTITRAQFSKILARLMEVDSNTKSFSDVKGHWAEGKINGLVKEGVIETSEYPNGFEPNKDITRLEISKMVARGLAEESLLWKAVLEGFGTLEAIKLPFSDQDEMSIADMPYIALANSSGIVGGYQDGTFKINRSATRAEATVMLKRYLDAKNKKPVLSELLEKFKGEPNLHQFSKAELENYIDKEADLERLRKHPIVSDYDANLAESYAFLLSQSSFEYLNENYFKSVTGFIEIYENRDYRTIGQEYINELRYYFKTRFTYKGKQYDYDELVDLFDLFVKETKNEKRISESQFVSDPSLLHQSKTGVRNYYKVRGTQYIRYTSGSNLPKGVELNKWYKRDIDVVLVNGSFDDNITWEFATNGFKEIKQITSYEEVK